MARFEPAAPVLIRLYNTDDHPCSYLPGEQACTQFVDPALPLEQSLVDALTERGFRRSGSHLYRPVCAQCQACQSLRVLVDEFRPSRSQRRCLQLNADLQCQVTAAAEVDHDRYYPIYAGYIDQRHGGGDMYPATREQYDAFIGASLPTTWFLEFYLDKDLIMVAQTDPVHDGLSAVYTFFDPQQYRRSLGTYAILKQIEAAGARGLHYLYLGYWVPDSKSMDYKHRFRPHEIYRRGSWQRL